MTASPALLRSSPHSIDLDHCYEKVKAKAVDYCSDLPTGEIVSKLSRGGFPLLSGPVEKPYASPAPQEAYDIAMMSFAFRQRPDRFDSLTEKNKDHIMDVMNKADDAVKNALHSHTAPVMTRSRYAALLSNNSSSRFLNVASTPRGIFNRMILFHAMPEHYGPGAAPKPYLKALKTMADFWGNLLEKKTKAQVNKFKESLYAYMLQTGSRSILMDYRPDYALVKAGKQSGFTVDALTFSLQAGAYYEETTQGPCVNLCDGGSKERIIQLESPTTPRANSRKARPLNLQIH